MDEFVFIWFATVLILVGLPTIVIMVADVFSSNLTDLVKAHVDDVVEYYETIERIDDGEDLEPPPFPFRWLNPRNLPASAVERMSS